MKAETNAALLLAKNYLRLERIKVSADVDTIEVVNVPKPLLGHFERRIKEMVTEEQAKSAALFEAELTKGALENAESE